MIENIKDISIIAAITLVTGFCFFLTNWTHYSGPIQALIWVLGIVLICVMAYFTSYGKQGLNFALEARIELLKVVWPTRQETTQTTLIVMTMVTVAGVVLWGVDSMLTWFIARLTQLS